MRPAPGHEECSCGPSHREDPPPPRGCWSAIWLSSTAARRSTDATSLVRLAGPSVPGEAVPIRVRRGSTGRTLEVVVGDRATSASPGSLGSVLVYYAVDKDRRIAENLAAELRTAINDPRYTVRTIKLWFAGRRWRGALQLVWSLDAGRDPGPKRRARGCLGTYRSPGRLHADRGSPGRVENRNRDRARKHSPTGGAASPSRSSPSSTPRRKRRERPRSWRNSCARGVQT